MHCLDIIYAKEQYISNTLLFVTSILRRISIHLINQVCNKECKVEMGCSFIEGG